MIDGEVTSNQAYSILSNPVIGSNTPSIPANPLPGCCTDYVIRVLADSTGNVLNNDSSGFYEFFDPIVTNVTMALQQWNGSSWVTKANLTDNTYGICYPFGANKNSVGQNIVGYQVNWANVLAAIGTGAYQIQMTATIPVIGNQVITSNEYCLQPYSQLLANGTVRLEWWNSGQIGDSVNDTNVRDFGALSLYNSLRVRGYFGYPSSDYKTNETQLNNGQFLFVEDEQTPIFSMELVMLPAFMHDILRTDFMQADSMCVTDYNMLNPINYTQKFLRKDSGYKPQWNILQSDLASVELTFRQQFNRFRKFRN